jgi:hypothetical protein
MRSFRKELSLTEFKRPSDEQIAKFHAWYWFEVCAQVFD